MTDCRHGDCDSSIDNLSFHPPSILNKLIAAKMVYSSRWALCAAVTSAAALQIPLLSSNNQALLGYPSGSKPLVNSTELQDLISGDRLLARSKKLFEIAKLGEEEYNHPTRVIGSAGMSMHVHHHRKMLISERSSRDLVIHLRDYSRAR